MNLLDKAVSWFSPAAGLQRARYRAAESVALAYEGARVGRRTDGWVTSGQSANAVIGPSLSILRNRARDLCINNPRASRLVSIHSTNLIGTGILPRARTGKPELDALIDGLFKAWKDECDADGQLDFFGLQHLIARTNVLSGEAITRFRNRRPSDGMTVPLQLQVLEPDYIDSNRNQSFAETQGGITIQGVVMDALGRRTGYWMFSQHPGEVIANKNFISKVVPAEEIVHVYRKDRPGQLRGVTWLAPVVLKLRDVDDYDDAEAMRKKIEACLAVFVTQPDGGDGQTLGPTSVSPLDSTVPPNRIETISPGMIEYLKPGEEANTTSPAPAGGYREYIGVQDHTIAAGGGVMYEQMTGDLSGVNYSSYRAGALEFNKSTDAYRWHVLIPMWCRPVWSRFIDTAFLAGLIPERNYGVVWTPPKFESVDPHKDAFAALVRMRSGTQTLYDAIAEQGNIPEDQISEIAEINKRLDADGIVLDMDPRRSTKSGVAQRTEESANG